MRVIEQLLGKEVGAEGSDLGEEQVQRLLYVLRSSGGAHGSALADALAEDAPTEVGGGGGGGGE